MAPASSRLCYALFFLSCLTVLTASAQQQDTVFQCRLIEEAPEFPGGAAALLKYIAAHLEYLQEKDDTDCSRVVAEFVVTGSGKIKQVRIRRSCGIPAFDEAVIRLVEDMPLWKPGKRNGMAVDCNYTLPVVFCRMYH